jgi:hypothetical protein
MIKEGKGDRMMRKLVMAVGLACVLALCLGGATSAADNMFEPPAPTPFPPPQWWEDDSSWFYYAEDWPFHWGLAVYYGEPVIVNYLLQGRDFFHDNEGLYNLQIHGTAKIYEASGVGDGAVPGELLDEQQVRIKVAFRDPVNTWGSPPRGWWPTEYYLYQYEQFDINWTIPGVYRGEVTCKDGHWAFSFLAHTSPPVRGGMSPNSPPYEVDALFP